jgi:hypothetical protein
MCEVIADYWYDHENGKPDPGISINYKGLWKVFIEVEMLKNG